MSRRTRKKTTVCATSISLWTWQHNGNPWSLRIVVCRECRFGYHGRQPGSIDDLRKGQTMETTLSLRVGDLRECEGLAWPRGRYGGLRLGQLKRTNVARSGKGKSHRMRLLPCALVEIATETNLNTAVAGVVQVFTYIPPRQRRHSPASRAVARHTSYRQRITSASIARLLCRRHRKRIYLLRSHENKTTRSRSPTMSRLIFAS